MISEHQQIIFFLSNLIIIFYILLIWGFKWLIDIKLNQNGIKNKQGHII